MLQFWNQKIIHVKLHQILHEASPDFQILDDFLSYEGLYPENWKYSFWCHSRYISFLPHSPNVNYCILTYSTQKSPGAL